MVRMQNRRTISQRFVRTPGVSLDATTWLLSSVMREVRGYFLVPERKELFLLNGMSLLHALLVKSIHLGLDIVAPEMIISSLNS